MRISRKHKKEGARLKTVSIGTTKNALFVMKDSVLLMAIVLNHPNYSANNDNQPCENLVFNI